jgi:hypothetical protein
MHDVKVEDVVLEPTKRSCNGDQVQNIKMMVDHVLKMKLTNDIVLQTQASPRALQASYLSFKITFEFIFCIVH